MPQVPVQNNFGVLPEVVNRPKLSAESFGAGMWKQIGENAQTMAKGAEAMENEQYAMGRIKARENLNNYRIGLEQLRDDITSHSELYFGPNSKQTATEAFQEGQKKLLASMQSGFGNDNIAKGIFNQFANEHSYNYFGQVSTWQRNQINEKEKQSLAASAALDLKDGNFDSFDKNMNTISYKKGLYKDGLQKEDKSNYAQALLKRMGELDPKLAIQRTQDLVKRGTIDEAVGNTMVSEWNQKIHTIDGKIASADSKDRLAQMKLWAQQNPSKIAALPESYFDGMTASDHAEGLAMQHKVNLGVPINDNQKVMAGIIAMGRKGDAPDPKTNPEEASSYSADNLAQNKWCFEHLDALDPKLQTRENMLKIVEQSKKPTLFFDEHGSNIANAYQAPLAQRLQEDTGDLFHWGRKQEFPIGTVPLESWRGKEADKGYAAIPKGTNKYDIYDLQDKKVVETVSKSELHGNTQ